MLSLFLVDRTCYQRHCPCQYPIIELLPRSSFNNPFPFRQRYTCAFILLLTCLNFAAKSQFFVINSPAQSTKCYFWTLIVTDLVTILIRKIMSYESCKVKRDIYYLFIIVIVQALYLIIMLIASCNFSLLPLIN